MKCIICERRKKKHKEAMREWREKQKKLEIEKVVKRATKEFAGTFKALGKE